MKHDGMSTRVNRGLAWIGIASTMVGVLDLFAILIILNNWISSEEYGVATKCIWVFPILDQISDLGLSAALIQREDHTEERVSTVFWINLMLSGALFLVLLVVAPPLARGFYGHAIVGWMLIAYGGKLLLQNGYFIPMAMLKRELRFKELSVVRICANLAEFLGKVGFAWAGFGVWCFVLGPLARTLVYVIGTQLRHPFRPRWLLNVADAKDYITFGLRSSGSQILFFFYTNVDYPIVGHFFGDSALGLYRLAYEVVLEPVRMISNVVVDIAFPAFARLRHSSERLLDQYVTFSRLNLVTVMSYSAVVFVAAPELIHVLFPHYVGADRAARILCAVAVLRSLGFVTPPLLDGVGRPDRTFTYMICAAITLPCAYITGALVLGPSMGFESVAVAWAIGYPIAFVVLVYMATQTLGWSALEYARRVGGVALCLFAAGALAAAGRYMLGSATPGIRLLVTMAIVVLASGVLLAYTQNMTLRGAVRSMRDPVSPREEP